MIPNTDQIQYFLPSVEWLMFSVFSKGCSEQFAKPRAVVVGSRFL